MKLRNDVQYDQGHGPLARLAQVLGIIFLAALLFAQAPLPRAPLAAAEEEASEEAGDEQPDAGDEDGDEDEGEQEAGQGEQEAVQQQAEPQPSDEELAQQRGKEKREECVAAIARGLRNHWMGVTGDVTSFEQYVQSIKDGAQTQLNQISLYAPEDFADEKFASLVDDYRTSLASQIEGIDGMLGDAGLYNKKYLDKGVLQRAKILAELKKSYGLKVDDMYAANLDEALHPNGARACAVGQVIRLTLPQGLLDVTVEGFDHDPRSTAVANKEGYLPKGKHVGMLLLNVHNESYALDYEGHSYVELNKIVHTCDATFRSFPAMAVSWDYADHKVAEGGYVELAPGKTERIAIPYLIDENLSDLIVRVGKKRFVYVKADETKQVETKAQSDGSVRIPLPQ